MVTFIIQWPMGYKKVPMFFWKKMTCSVAGNTSRQKILYLALVKLVLVQVLISSTVANYG